MGVQAGWYPDPSGDPNKARYWDGTQWTDNYKEIQQKPAFILTPETDQPSAQATPVYTQTDTTQTSTDTTLRLIAFIFNVISTVCGAILVLPLAWMIPMTVHSWKIYKGTKPNTVAFGVCNLIFLDLVSGILLLVSKKDA